VCSSDLLPDFGLRSMSSLKFRFVITLVSFLQFKRAPYLFRLTSLSAHPRFSDQALISLFSLCSLYHLWTVDIHSHGRRSTAADHWQEKSQPVSGQSSLLKVPYCSKDLSLRPSIHSLTLGRLHHEQEKDQYRLTRASRMPVLSLTVS